MAVKYKVIRCPSERSFVETVAVEAIDDSNNLMFSVSAPTEDEALNRARKEYESGRYLEFAIPIR